MPRRAGLGLVVFAHTPPPHHGQSYMVAILLAALRAPPPPGQPPIRCYHVDARFSDDAGQIGRAGAGKLARLLGYCARAWWLRFRHGADTLYYVPAPGKRVALYRDWLVLALCRPVYRRLVLHWHAVGLGAWLDSPAALPWERRLSRRLLGGADLSLVLARHNVPDQEGFGAKLVRVVPNGIADPCPGCEETLLPQREARARARRAGEEQTVQVLFLAHCLPEKGVFDALEAVALMQARLLAAGSAVRLRLVVAGEFVHAPDRAAFDARLARADLHGSKAPEVICVGFISGQEKDRQLRVSDVFIFPTYYPNEGMPVALIEALAYGLPVVSTRWRAIPEMLPPQGTWLVEPRHPEWVADAMEAALRTAAEDFAALRRHYREHFELNTFAANARAALAELGNAPRRDS